MEEKQDGVNNVIHKIIAFSEEPDSTTGVGLFGVDMLGSCILGGKKMVRVIHNLFIIILCGIFVLVQWGCATHNTFQRTPIEQLGKLGLVYAQYTPAVDFELPAKGWLGGVGRGAAKGTESFIRLVPNVVVGSAGVFLPPPAGIGALLLAVGSALAGAGYLVIGPFYGAAVAQAPETVEDSETQLKAALASMRIQKKMLQHVSYSARHLANVNLTVLDGQGPESSSDLLTYFPINDTRIGGVLELRVNRVWLRTKKPTFPPVLTPEENLQINPSLSLGMEVRGRVIQTRGKIVLFDDTWTYAGEPRLFDEWAANNAKLFAEEFEHAYEELANEVVNSIFKDPSRKS